MTGARALQYAEQTLGVHAVHLQALEAEERLAKARARFVALRSDKQEEESSYADAELTFIGDARASLPDMSQAQFDRHIKVAVNADPDLRSMRAALAARSRQVDSAEYELSVARTRVEVCIARMNELGGYFVYLAAVKNAETAQRHPTSPEGDWPSASAVARAATPATPPETPQS